MRGRGRGRGIQQTLPAQTCCRLTDLGGRKTATLDSPVFDPLNLGQDSSTSTVARALGGPTPKLKHP